MKILERPFETLALIELRYFQDNRGFFGETFRKEWQTELGIGEEFVQENHSRSFPKVLRGLHMQRNPSQGKLVSVKRGRIWDVAVDLRPGSPTFSRHYSTELSERNTRMLWIPPGFAHGFCVLGEEPADVTYQVTGYYNAAGEIGLRWNDPDLAIPWPLEEPIVSEKDSALPPLRGIQHRL